MNTTASPAREGVGPVAALNRPAHVAPCLDRYPSAERTADGAAKIALLAGCFPSLRGAPGVDPWSVPTFGRWVGERERTAEARTAGHFVLSCWSPLTPETLGLGRFAIERAVGVLDARALAVVTCWLAGADPIDLATACAQVDGGVGRGRHHHEVARLVGTTPVRPEDPNGPRVVRDPRAQLAAERAAVAGDLAPLADLARTALGHGRAPWFA